MAMLSFTSTSTSHQDTHLKNVSFSSYPSTDDDTFVRKLTDTMSPIMATAQDHLGLARKKEEDGELRVFEAEKYFNGRADEESPKQQLQQQQQYKKEETRTYDMNMIQSTKPVSVNRHGSSSIESESSWNSQSALLQSVMRNTKVKKANKARRKSFLGSLSCNCVCSDKDSVDIAQDNVGDIRYNLVHAKPVITKDPIKTVHEAPSKPQNKERCFSLPNPSPVEPNLPIMVQFQVEDDEKARKSLEVFGSPLAYKRNKSFNIEGRFAKLGWETNPRVLQEDQETEFEDNGVYESGSDASSDLFEIESLTGKANHFLARQSYDVPSGCVTPTTCYAPSEASIEWSVVTASAADFSALSDYEDHRPAMFTPAKPRKVIAQRRRPNILLSCKSHKAVRVAGDAYVASDKVHADHSPRTRHGSDHMIPVTRFQGGNKMMGFDSRQQHGLAKHQTTRSHSPRSSHLLYIQ